MIANKEKVNEKRQLYKETKEPEDRKLQIKDVRNRRSQENEKNRSLNTEEGETGVRVQIKWGEDRTPVEKT